MTINPKDTAAELRKWAAACSSAYLPKALVEFMSQCADTIDDLSDEIDQLKKDLHECQCELDKFEDRQMWEDANQ